MPIRVTLAEIARRADVHPTTVSMALRNHPRLRAETIERIKALAEEMGYRPDPALSALVAYRRNASSQQSSVPIAYLTGWDTKWGWRNAPAHLQFYEGATKRAEQMGYQLEHFWIGEDKMSNQRLSEILRARGISGVIVASHARHTESTLELQWNHFSCVKIDYLPKKPHIHAITNDQRTIIQLAFQRVMDLGYKRIGFVMPDWWDRYVNLAWSSGFLAMQHTIPSKRKVPLLSYKCQIVSNADIYESAVPTNVLKKWIDRNQPDAIISYKPFVRNALETLNIKIPEDIAYADIFLEDLDGQTAGVVNNCRRVGELAVEIVAGQLQQYKFGLPEIATATKVEGPWIDGATLPPVESNFEAEPLSLINSDLQ